VQTLSKYFLFVRSHYPHPTLLQRAVENDRCSRLAQRFPKVIWLARRQGLRRRPSVRPKSSYVQRVCSEYRKLTARLLSASSSDSTCFSVLPGPIHLLNARRSFRSSRALLAVSESAPGHSATLLQSPANLVKVARRRSCLVAMPDSSSRLLPVPRRSAFQFVPCRTNISNLSSQSCLVVVEAEAQEMGRDAHIAPVGFLPGQPLKHLGDCTNRRPELLSSGLGLHLGPS
jgi:hypothetical protein